MGGGLKNPVGDGGGGISERHEPTKRGGDMITEETRGQGKEVLVPRFLSKQGGGEELTYRKNR